MIKKVGLAVIRHKKILLAKKRGLPELILPGGKQEGQETFLKALRRELVEETGCLINNLKYAGTFIDKAAGKEEMVQIRLYTGDLKSEPIPKKEIESLFWTGHATKKKLSPILKNKIFPHLKKKRLL